MFKKGLSSLLRIGWFFETPHRTFLALALPFGIIYIFLSAPFQAPDEDAHFYRAYAISTGHFVGLKVSLPESVMEFSTTVSKDLPGNDQNKQSKKALVQEFFRPFSEQPQVEISTINSAIVSPVPYLPQAAGVLIGRLLRLNPIFIFYLGRITNFLVWLGITFIAIKITPVHHRLFAALALMPMTLHQAASNSPDAATIAITFLLIAYSLRILMDQRPKVDWSDWIKIAILTIVVALCKSIYLLTAGLLLAVVFRRFRLQRSTLPMVVMIIGLGLVSGLLWLQISSREVSVKMMNAAHTPTTAGILYILQHPQAAAPVLWQSAINHTGEQMRQFIGILGWADTPLPAWVYPLYYVMLLFTVLFEPHSPFYFYLHERLWIAILAVSASLVLMAIFFYPEVSIGNGEVDMAQGRYFIPFGMLYFLPFSQRKWCISSDSPVWIGIALLHGLVLVVSVRAMLWRYYAI